MKPEESGVHDHIDGGVTHDLPRLLSRRRALTLLGGGGAALLAACSAGGTAREASGPVPAEARGPFPADGSNGRDVLGESGVVRRDIRTGIGASSATAEGLPLTIRLRVLRSGAPFAGAAVYLWQCDRNGDYSLYTGAAAGESYLRGVQVADAAGLVEFLSVFPGCYPGRWPHLHVEIYRRVADVTSSGRALRTTQLALPEDACAQAYSSAGYAASARHLSEVSLERDVAFADGYARQLLTITGGNDGGWTAELDVAV